MTEIETTIWKFTRNDLPAVEFEQWVYAHPELEKFWGNEFYLSTAKTKFFDTGNCPVARACNAGSVFRVPPAPRTAS